jgi:hypothetical protein
MQIVKQKQLHSKYWKIKIEKYKLKLKQNKINMFII